MPFVLYSISKNKSRILKLKSPSKLNFGLWIKHKREDGYHELETIFYEHNDLYDELQIELIEGSKVLVNSKFTQENLNEIIPSDQNLTTLAAKLFLDKVKITGLCSILINKKIPFQAGLGSASSNAACVLKGLNNFFGNKLTMSELIELALKIGSDVPFFIIGGTCHAKGRGEFLNKIENNLKLNVKIIKPENISISTKWAYEQIDLNHNNRQEKINSLIKAVKLGDHELFCENIFNDFEDVVFTKFQELIKLKTDLLSEGYKAVSLCGSGSALFAVS